MVLLLVGFGVRAIHQGVYTRADAARLTPTPAQAGGGGGSRWVDVRPATLVGAVHGLAGSGALTALVVADAAVDASPGSATWRCSALGTTAGMAVLSGLVGWPLARVAAHPWVARSLSVAVGGVSIVLGLVWGYPLVARLVLNRRSCASASAARHS